MKHLYKIEEGKKRVYCELVGTANFTGTKVKVTVDFGQKVTWGSDQQLVGTDGKKLKVIIYYFTVIN